MAGQLSLNTTYGWSISVSNFPREAPSPTRRMSVQFILNKPGLSMRSDDHPISTPPQSTEERNDISIEAVSHPNVEIDSRSPTPVSPAAGRSSTPPGAKPQFNRAETPPPKSSPLQEEEGWKTCLQTRSQLRTIMGLSPKIPVNKRELETEEVPRKRHKTVVDDESSAPEEVNALPEPAASSKTTDFSKSQSDAASPTETAPQIIDKADIDSRYDRSALVSQNGQWLIPRRCHQSPLRLSCTINRVVVVNANRSVIAVTPVEIAAC